MAHNQKLVYLIARKHSFRAKSMSIADLMQEGNLGLHRAAEKFDYTRGFRFSTYASNWVIQAVIRGIYEGGFDAIRISFHAYNNFDDVEQVLAGVRTAKATG